MTGVFSTLLTILDHCGSVHCVCILDSLDHSRHSQQLQVHVPHVHCRLVKDIIQEEANERNKLGFRITGDALTALHTSAKAYLVGLLEDANLITLHSRQVTLQQKDIQLARRIRGEQGKMEDPSVAKFGCPNAPRSVEAWSGATVNSEKVHISINKM